MPFVVMQQREAGQYTYPEINEAGEVKTYQTREVAEARASELGGIANGYKAEDEHESDLLYQYGLRSAT